MKEKNIKVNAVLNMIKTISSIIFPLITFPYVSRVLMPENIGKVNFGSSFVSYFSLIASLGITTYAIRECSTKRDDKNELSKTASQIFSINVITTIIAYALMAVTLLLFRNFDSYRTLIIIQSTAILFTTLGCDWLNSAMEDFTFITIRTIAFQFVSLVLMFVFVHEPGDYMKYAAISVVASSGANVVNVFYRKRYCAVRFVKDMEWKKHFKPIVLLFVMLLAQTIFHSSDITMLGLMKGDYEVGLYSTAVKIVNLVVQLMASILWVLLPRLSLYFENNDYKNLNEKLNQMLYTFVSLGFPCAVGCVCLSDQILCVVGGNEYIAASPILNILMIGFIFSLLGEYFLGNMTLLPSKREAIYMKIYCISMLINLILNYIFIPYGGTIAAAIATDISHLFVLIACFIVRDKKIKLNINFKMISSIMVGCILIFAICKMVSLSTNNIYLNLALSMSFSVAGYLLVQIVMKNELVIGILRGVLARLRKR